MFYELNHLPSLVKLDAFKTYDGVHDLKTPSPKLRAVAELGRHYPTEENCYRTGLSCAHLQGTLKLMWSG